MRRAILTGVSAAAILLIAGAGPAARAGPEPGGAATTLLAVAVLVAVAVAIARRVDVRLVLILGAIPLFLATARLPELVGTFAQEMANPRTVVPIGSALGFAHVLKLTGCDQHLVHLLLRPVRLFRVLLVPGGVAAGYLVNTTIVSQTGAAAVIGPILVPLLRAGGFPPAAAGAVLLLGCSMGGELFNPAAVEMSTLAELTHSPPGDVIARVAPLNLLACGIVLLTFWGLTSRGPGPVPEPIPGASPVPPETGAGPATGQAGPFRVNPIKAAVPTLPLVLLFAAPTFLHLPPAMAAFERPASILAAMLIGVAAALVTTPACAARAPAAFFEGAGYAYTHVISLIVAATVFADGVKATPLIGRMTAGLADRPLGATAVGVALPWLLANVSGSGIAPAVAVMKSMVPSAGAMGLGPIRLGALISLGGHFGRTMSPAAAVVAMSAALSSAPPGALLRRVAPPLVVGGAVLLLANLLRLI